MSAKYQGKEDNISEGDFYSVSFSKSQNNNIFYNNSNNEQSNNSFHDFNKNNCNSKNNEKNAYEEGKNLSHDNNALNPYNNNQEIQTMYDPNNVFKKYDKDPKTSLSNLGDNSYLNSVLQFIGHIPNLAIYFLNPKNQKIIDENIKTMPLSFVTERLFIHLYPFPLKPEYETYSGYSYLKVLASLNLVYKTGKYERKNPNELLLFILETLHNEINNYNLKHKPQNISIDNSDNLNTFIKNFAYNKTIISDLNWFQLEKKICSNCSLETNNFLAFSTFNLDIMNLGNNSNEITIYDCLQLFGNQKKKKLCCNNCGNKFQIMFSQKFIFTFNNTIIFMMDRGINFDKANILMNIHFKIEEKINLAKFILNDNSHNQFKLSAIISISIKENKYICFCKSLITNEWFIYNDHIVDFTDLGIILKEHNKDKIYIPCILLYQFE